MPLHKVPVGLWKRLRLREGICSRLPAHYLRSLEEARTPTPVHFRPHGAKFKINPKNGQRERVEDVPIPVHYPPESQLGPMSVHSMKDGSCPSWQAQDSPCLVSYLPL